MTELAPTTQAGFEYVWAAYKQNTICPVALPKITILIHDAPGHHVHTSSTVVLILIARITRCSLLRYLGKLCHIVAIGVSAFTNRC